VGECRRAGGGTMCPSYMVTREEMHSTRGRARLLFEMLQGETIRGGWRDAHVREALDLCLACKGCKSDCPMNVDMATYKAEFLSHYYEGRLRPRAAYAMGLVHWWLRAASWAPAVANFFGHTPPFAPLVKRLAGVAPAREIPRLAPMTFREWFARREPRSAGGDPVILWTDTFTDHFLPETARHAVQVLEAAGCRVEIPPRSLCCGRPLYDYGMLRLATSLLRSVLTTLRPAIRAGTPVVVLEPSCAAVFRDEMIGLLPDDLDARRLSAQTQLLGDFLAGRAAYRPPHLPGRALLHGHCHQKALVGLHAETRLLESMGLEVGVLDSGCCGMAGSFGFEAGHYELSIAVGERVLLPAVRAADRDTLIVSDGFSCREQIAQATGRRALHLADVLALAHGPASGVETAATALRAADGARGRPRALVPALAVGAVLLTGLLAARQRRRH